MTSTNRAGRPGRALSPVLRRSPPIVIAWALAGGTALSLHATPLPPPPEAEVLPHDTSDTLSLAGAVRRVLEVDPDVQAAEAGTGTAEAELDAARAARFPSLASSAGAVRFEEPMAVAPIHGLDPMAAPDFDRTLLQARVELGYTLWDGGVRGARIDGARASRASRQATTAAVRQQVAETAVQAYLAVLTARDVGVAQAARRAELEAERERATRFLEEGTAPRLELLRAEAELSAALADETAATARVERAEFLLASLLDRAPSEVQGTDLGDVAITGATAADDPEELTGHPVLTAATSRLEAARSVEEASRAARHPVLRASGAFVEYGGGSSDYTGEWQAGLRLEYPLFTGGARRAEVARARAQVRGAEAELRSIRRELERTVDAARSAEREALARAGSLTDAVERFEELARIEALALEEGVGIQRDFLRAQAGLLEARAGLAEARRAAALARVRLARALGLLTPEWIARTLEPVS